MQKLFVFLLLSTLPTAELAPVSPERILGALTRALNFVYENCKDVNVDGMFGVVLAEAHLTMILKEDFHIVDRMEVEKLRWKASSVRKAVQKYLPEIPHKYWVFKNLIAVPSMWRRKIDYVCGKLNLYQRPPFFVPFDITAKEGFLNYIRNSTFNENQSDHCLVEITFSHHNKCFISDKCRKVIFSPYDSNYQAYGVTRRLMYLQVARARNCSLNEELFNAKIVEFCSYILWEAEKIRYFRFPKELTDLVFEQVVLCGYEGFAEFLNSRYLSFALTTQRCSGCYSNGIPFHIWKRWQASTDMYRCSSHTTGLGISLLASFLRFFVYNEINTQ